MRSALAQAWRSWASAKGLAVLAAAAFAIGIGSATAIYTVLNGILLKPLPYPHAERFVALYSGSLNEPESQRGSHRFPDLIEFQQRARSFDVFGWFRPGGSNLTFAGQPQHVPGIAVTASLAHTIGVSPMIGQWFSDPQHAVISYALWRRLGAHADIVGKPVTLDDRMFTITGVMPPGFRLPVPGPGISNPNSEFWIPLDPLGKDLNPGDGFYFCYARLKPGVTFAQAEDDVKRVAAEIAANDPAGHPSYTVKLDSLRESVILDIRPTLILLIVAAGVLLVITCVDVAGLLLSRSVARARETAIRVALGAGRRQLALHYFLEALMVSLAGAAAGIGVSALLVAAVLRYAADHIPRAEDIALDWSVLLFSVAVASVVSALVSLAPLWQAMRTAPADVLNEGVRSSASARSRRLSRSLVVAEMALAFMLLTVSAVLVMHLRSLGRILPGFDPHNLLTFDLTMPNREGSEAPALLQRENAFVRAIEAIPGVTSVGLSNQIPLDGCCISTSIFPEGRPDTRDIQRTALMAVSAGYFRTLQLPLKSGRLLDDRDIREEPLNAVVNEAAVKVNWPHQTPIGAFGRAGNQNGSRFQVVGVVGDIRNDGLGKPTVPEIYLLSALVPLNLPVAFVVRSPLPPESLIPQVREAIQRVDPTQAINQVAMMDDIMTRSVTLPRISSFMTGFFAAAALLMASLGIFGVVSYAVRQGTVEIGTRMALGAIGRDLLLMIVGSGLRMAASGALIGTIAVLASGWLLLRVFEIERLGVIPFLFSTTVVGLVAVAASFFPAWRATSLSPMVAIRNETRTTWRSARLRIRDLMRKWTADAGPTSEALATFEADVVTEFVTAARNAASFSEAFQIALATLRDRLGATSLTLLERHGDEFRTLVAVPEAVARTLPAPGFLSRRLSSYSYPAPISPADLESWKRWASENSPTYLAEIETLTDLDVRMVAALKARNEIAGLLILGPPAGRPQYSEAQRMLLRPCAEQLTLMLENARLTSRVVEQEKLRRDLALAAEVQKRLLPDHPPDREGAALAAVSLPARSVGGDYYDFIDLGDHRIGIALADVAGKGVPAALLMAVVQASLRIVASDGRTSIPELAEKINGFLHRSTASNSYATFFYAQLDERSRRLTYVNAGHNPPYLVRPADIQELNIGGTVLGLFPQMTYEQATVDMQPGDVLVAFTDGVTEAMNASEEEFGEARLKQLLQSVMHLPAAEISERISAELRGWIKDTAQYDDLTFVVLTVN
jgi:putative ABC transport system permease protein